jgi:hypothetical protein
VKPVTKRHAARLELERLVGVHEVGFSNHGPIVDKIEAADTLPGDGYSYCQSTQNYTWHLANDELLAGGTASVWFFVSTARKRKWVVPTWAVQQDDHITFDFGEGSGGPYDHVGQVIGVVKVGPVMVVRTIEGNTSPSSAGSQSNGGGIYRKTRIVKASTVCIVRVPGECPHAARYQPKPTAYERWAAWYLHGRKRSRRPKDAPARISAAWWARLRKQIAAAKSRRSR